MNKLKNFFKSILKIFAGTSAVLTVLAIALGLTLFGLLPYLIIAHFVIKYW